MADPRVLKLLTGCICSSLMLSVLPSGLESSVCADTFASFENENLSSTKKCRSVEDLDYTAEVTTTSRWSGHSNIEIRFTNTGNEIIHDWYFTFDLNYDIENPYNCYIFEHADNLYTLANNDWNQDILPGQSVTVGFTAASDDSSDVTDMPSFYLLNTKTVSISNTDLSYRFEEYYDWTTGFSGALILTNNSSEQIRDWTVKFSSNRPVTQADAAVLTSNADGTYTLTNDGSIQNIPARQSYRIELQGGEHDPSVPLTLTDISIIAKAPALGLTEDNDGNGIADVLETDYYGTITVTPTASPTVTSMPVVTDTPVPTNTLTSTPIPSITVTSTPTNTVTVTSTPTITPTMVPTITVTPTVTVTSTPVITVIPTDTDTPTPTVVPTDFPDDIDYYTDSDSDGLPDDLEDYYGTDKNDKDTDDDGVNDLYELILGTDPLTPDSNGNADPDMDGLTNAQESDLGTNPKSRDTDFDGLSDGEEVNLYGTDPKKYDTDDDGINDYNEIHLGSNPNVPDSDIKREQTLEFEPSGDSGLNGVTKVRISGYISGSIEENTKIKDIYGKDLHTSSIEALVGDPVNIESTGEFDTMTITFEYRDGLNENNLRIMWYDEENCVYKVLDEAQTDPTHNRISVETTHFSKYMLIDEAVWVNTWVSSCYEVDDVCNMFVQGYLHSPNRFKEYMSSKYPDRDSDGLVDILETTGMIDNIGHVIRTDPDSPFSDRDILTDGIEMGEFGMVKEIIPREVYSKHIDFYSVSAGSRIEDNCFLKNSSDPLMDSSDGDDAMDGKDATPNDANEPINYILIGKDYEGKNALSSMRQPYIDAFRKRDENVIVLDIYSGSEYHKKFEDYLSFHAGYKVTISPCLLVKYTFNCLKYNLGESVIVDEERYSYVEKMVIIAHGRSYFIQFEEFDDINSTDGFVSLDDIKEINPICKINILDIQACYCGGGMSYIGTDLFGNTPCVASEFASKYQIDKVYAWTGSAFFIDIGFNYSFDGGYVLWYMDEDKNTKYKFIGISPFISFPLVY